MDRILFRPPIFLAFFLGSTIPGTRYLDSIAIPVFLRETLDAAPGISKQSLGHFGYCLRSPEILQQLGDCL